MLKEAIEKIVSLATPVTFNIGGDTYTSESLRRVAPYIERPQGTELHSLAGIVHMVRAEIERTEISKPLFVHTASHRRVEVYTTLRTDNQSRDTLYTAEAVLPESAREWMEYEAAMISLRSQYICNEGVDYILDLLSSVSDENSVKSTDNGLSQQVTARTGVALSKNVGVKPIVKLRPYRTFLEVEQPESEFLLRLQSGDEKSAARVGIIPADGGTWKLAAKENIAAYFRLHLSDFVDKGLVVIAE